MGEDLILEDSMVVDGRVLPGEAMVFGVSVMADGRRDPDAASLGFVIDAIELEGGRVDVSLDCGVRIEKIEIGNGAPIDESLMIADLDSQFPLEQDCRLEVRSQPETTVNRLDWFVRLRINPSGVESVSSMNVEITPQ